MYFRQEPPEAVNNPADIKEISDFLLSLENIVLSLQGKENEVGSGVEGVRRSVDSLVLGMDLGIERRYRESSLKWRIFDLNLEVARKKTNLGDERRYRESDLKGRIFDLNLEIARKKTNLGDEKRLRESDLKGRIFDLNLEVARKKTNLGDEKRLRESRLLGLSEDELTKQKRQLGNWFEKESQQIQYWYDEELRKLNEEEQRIQDWYDEDLRKANEEELRNQDWYNQKMEELNQEIELRQKENDRYFNGVKNSNEKTLGLMEIENFLNLARNGLYIQESNYLGKPKNKGTLLGKLQIVKRFQPVLSILSQEGQNSRLLEYADRYGLDYEEFLKMVAIRLLGSFKRIWEDYERTGSLDLSKIDLEAGIISSLFKELKSGETEIDLLNNNFFTYIDGPNFPDDENHTQIEAFFSRIEELYDINYEGQTDFLNALKPRIREKAKMKCSFKTLYWNRDGNPDFAKDPRNIIGCLYFIDAEDDKGKKIPNVRYLGGVNIDPNFQNSGVAMFISRAIREEFAKPGVEAIYLVASSDDSAKFWESLGFDRHYYIDEKIPKNDGWYITLPGYKMTKEKFNQLSSKSQ
ncbi:MAG: GNAT family N-acetyltransferase [Candidatus Gracilibacteria bacterium]|nr:GNAT family N-acetyltransferase [Candidatus Gracilibacteria bacterium]